MIEKNPNITQRAISKEIGIAVSMVNDYLEEYEKNGYVKRDHHTTKTVNYIITKSGSERKKVLNIGYLNASQRLYNSAKENIDQFLKEISEKGFHNILLYGAGEVAEILLSAIKTSHEINVNALAIIDDDTNKYGKKIVLTDIISKNEIKNFKHDAILISSYSNRHIIKLNLKNIHYPIEKILEFF
jgi:FlaA1/EpsC-like NDP-sugar epimerase